MNAVTKTDRWSRRPEGSNWGDFGPDDQIGRLNLISVAFIPLFVGLGVDFGIQICVRFNAERMEGAAAPEALRDAAAALGAPLLLAAGAVFLGFGAFLPTAYVGIAELGVIAGLGMVIALLFSVTLLPALVLLLRPGAPRGLGLHVGFRMGIGNLRSELRIRGRKPNLYGLVAPVVEYRQPILVHAQDPVEAQFLRRPG